MNPASKDIAQFLNEDTGLGLVLGTDLFFGQVPPTPDVAVTVLDNPGGPPMLTYKKATSNYFYSSVSVQIRDYDYAAGWERAHAILTYLHALSQTDSPDASSYYGLIRALNDPQVLHWDGNDRVTFFINFDIQRKPI